MGNRLVKRGSRRHAGIAEHVAAFAPDALNIALDHFITGPGIEFELMAQNFFALFGRQGLGHFNLVLGDKRCRAEQFLTALNDGRYDMARRDGPVGIGLMRHPHALHGTRGRFGGKHARGRLDLVGRHPGDFRYLIQCIFLSPLRQCIKAVAPLGDKCLVVKIFLDDDIDHAQQQGAVRSRSKLEPQIRRFSRF